ncbi:MAG: RpiR family carbohydrate utilization transcriptional regulator [Oceanicoccus sp.]|jgi:RpiR family carbohydrate utilization transcriptional regulator
MTVLLQLNKALATLSRAESLLAKVILADPEKVVNISTAELAKLAGVSDPMVSRLSKTLGCKSFPDFKVQLAQSLVTRESFISEAVDPGDGVSSYIDKRINANQAALEYIRGHLQPDIIEAAVTALSAAQQILIFGLGGSAAVAQDAQHKIFRLGIPTIAYSDHLMQRMAAAGADENTVVLIFSVTGRTETTLEVADIVKQSEATLIAITGPDSPLGQLADITIPSGDELEDTTIYIPMTTRIVILTVIDILATGMALSQGEAGDQRLLKIKHSLDATKLS